MDNSAGRSRNAEPPSANAGAKKEKAETGISSDIIAGAMAGVGGGLAAQLFGGGTLTFPIWFVTYLLVISALKHKLVATIAFVAVAALVSVLLQSMDLSFLGDSDNVSAPVDALKGHTSPAQLNEQINGILAQGQAALEYDERFVSMFGWGILVLGILAVIGAGFSLYRFFKRDPPTIRPYAMVLVIYCVFAILPFGGSCWLWATSENTLKSVGIVSHMSNENTDPALVGPGQKVRLDLSTPSPVKALFQEYRVLNFDVTSATAHLSDDRKIPITPSAPSMCSADIELPGRTDFVRLSGHVNPWIRVTLPDDASLSGAIAELAVTAKAELLIAGSGMSYSIEPKTFSGKTRFRIARPVELQFAGDQDAIASRLWFFAWTTFLFAAIVNISLICILCNFWKTEEEKKAAREAANAKIGGAG